MARGLNIKETKKKALWHKGYRTKTPVPQDKYFEIAKAQLGYFLTFKKCEKPHCFPSLRKRISFAKKINYSITVPCCAGGEIISFMASKFGMNIKYLRQACG